MQLSVIILAHNKNELTIACLKAIRSADLPNSFEVLLVDNASNPSLKQSLDEELLKSTNTKILRNSKNLNFSIANNIAAEMAQGEYLLFLNNDVEISGDTVLLLMQTIKKDQGPSLVGGMLLYPNSKLVQHAGVSHMLWGIGSNYGCGAKSDEKALNFKREIYGVIGAMMLIKKKWFRKVGGFDENYNWGYEDIDLCQRIRAIGGRIFYEPKASAIHHESTTLKEKISKKRDSLNYQYFRSRWDELLIPAETTLINKYKNLGIRSVAIYGTGNAAIELGKRLAMVNIQTQAFISELPSSITFEGKPVYNLSQIDSDKFDQIFIGSQYHFEISKMLKKFVPEEKITFPVVIE